MDTGREEEEGDNGVIWGIGWRDPLRSPFASTLSCTMSFNSFQILGPNEGLTLTNLGRQAGMRKRKKKVITF